MPQTNFQVVRPISSNFPIDSFLRFAYNSLVSSQKRTLTKRLWGPLFSFSAFTVSLGVFPEIVGPGPCSI